MLALLLALVVVAWLAKDALVKYGLAPDARSAQKKAGVPADAAPAQAAPMDAARGLEKSLQDASRERGGGY